MHLGNLNTLYPNDGTDDVHFVGFELVDGNIGLKKGSLVLKREGTFSRSEGVKGEIEIVPRSGAGDFVNLIGGGEVETRITDQSTAYYLNLL